jgi:hypothetical protein
MTGFVQPGPTFPDEEGEDDDMDLGELYGEEEEEGEEEVSHPCLCGFLCAG